MDHRGHGIALYSGGLDSAIAIMLILRQNVKVTALTFMTHFGCDINDKSSCSSSPYPLAKKYGFTAKMMHLGQKFVDIVRNPKYGHGKNMNPCIDCRILMLREATEFMNMVGADFVFTGEVVGQRPMSQHKPTMQLIKEVSGLEGKLVRPLSAKLLDPTEPELNGILDREKLENISGRSRKRQIELAREYGIEEFPAPAAGCLLTDVGYSRRLRDLFSHTEQVDFNDLNLLRVGRHFRVDPQTKLIVGRNEEDNNKIKAYRREDQWLFEAKGIGSPLTLLDGHLTARNIEVASALTARYSDQKRYNVVEVTYFQNGDQSAWETLYVPPLIEDRVKAYLI